MITKINSAFSRFLMVSMFISNILGVFGQNVLINRDIKQPVVVKGGTCALHSREVDLLLQEVLDDDNLIIISHLSKSEKKKSIGMRRLHNAKTYIVERKKGDKYEKYIVTAEGAKVEGTGYLDFYFQGNLSLRIYIPNGKDFSIALCVIEPPNKPCESYIEKMYYPCRK